MATDTKMSKSPRLPVRMITRILTAIVGGYLFINVLSIFIAYAIPSIRDFAVAYGLMFGFLLWAVSAIWVFAQRSLWRGCASIWLVTLLLAVGVWGYKVFGVLA